MHVLGLAHAAVDQKRAEILQGHSNSLWKWVPVCRTRVPHTQAALPSKTVCCTILACSAAVPAVSASCRPREKQQQCACPPPLPAPSIGPAPPSGQLQAAAEPACCW